MLAPDNRKLYVNALTPPVGYRLDEAVATTFSLDLTSLLTVPVHLALAQVDPKLGIENNALVLLKALRRVARNVTVFVDAGRIHVPDERHVLYGLLESMIVEARAPRRGAFHPKIWTLRFLPEADNEPPLLRVLVLSRNLTADRSWDISLQLDGAVRNRVRLANRPLAELVKRLPDLGTKVSRKVRERTARFAIEIERAQWELPDGFDDVQFHLLGFDERKTAFQLDPSNRLLVISPFVTKPALQHLAETTREPVALISRAEELDALPSDADELFSETFVLDEAASTEDGEEAPLTSVTGLHAKAYVAERGWNTHVYVGSANTTSAALLEGKNVEILAELWGKRSRVKGIDEMLSQDGLRSLLVEYARSEAKPAETEAEKAAKKALENARRALSQAELDLRFVETERGWVGTLRPRGPVELEGIERVAARLVSLPLDATSSVQGPRWEDEVTLPPCGSASITGLVALEILAEASPMMESIVRNVPAQGVPEDRDAQILRVIVSNEDRFLTLLRSLLASEEDALVGGLKAITNVTARPSSSSFEEAAAGLLEEMVRVHAHRPERLEEIEVLLRDLARTGGADDVVPPAFMQLWETFHAALGSRR